MATLALSQEQYITIIETILSGFEYNGRKYKPNLQIAMILQLEANLGMRCGDILRISYGSIKRDGDRYIIDMLEEKTNKSRRRFTVDDEVYETIAKYFIKNNLRPQDKLFNISLRQVQRFLKDVCLYLGYENISTHSFRKYCATKMYINSDHDIELVREFLQHSSVAITQKYLNMGSKRLEKAIKQNTEIIFKDF